jgi:ATP adenylyltransferase
MDTSGLWQAVQERTRQALASGAQVPIATEREELEDAGLRFIVHILSRMEHKLDVTATQARRGINPFMPPDPALTVAELPPAHLCVLNKFNVIDHHMLIITRHFEDQQSLLTLGDWVALARCMAAIDGLAFYNSGTVAGASQHHKHLQLVPLPLARGAQRTPVDGLLAAASTTPSRLAGLPFVHAAVGLGGALISNSDGDRLHQHYRMLLAGCRLDTRPRPHNLLLTRDWMLIVPRSQECFAGISVNALGFAGSLLVRDRSQLELVRTHGPMNVLHQVAEPA